MHDVYFYSLAPPTGVTNIGNMADGYIIHVPKGYLSLYETQFTGHKGHFAEFEYLKVINSLYERKLSLGVNVIKIKDVFINSKFDEGYNFSYTPVYSGNNIASFDTFTLDENNTLFITITRSSDISYNLDENIVISAKEETSGCNPAF